MTMEVAVVGTDIDPKETEKEEWIMRLKKRAEKLENNERHLGHRHGAGDAAAANAATVATTDGSDTRAYREAGRKLAERSIASDLPRLPATGWKVVLRPKEGLTMLKSTTEMRIAAAIRENAGIKDEEALKDRLAINAKQGTITYHSPSYENARKVEKLETVKIGDKERGVTTYMNAPESCGRGVIHGIDVEYTHKYVLEGLNINGFNPLVIDARRMGKTKSFLITFEEEKVPRRVVLSGITFKCFLYKKRYEVCYKCGGLGHRSDVCDSEVTKCRGCGMTSPPEGHQCTPQCQLCGKEHYTGDKRCKNLFRTPYIVKKRQWEAKQEAEEAKQEDRRNSRSRDRSGSRTRFRSESFPRLQTGQQQPRKEQAAKVSWPAKVSQDSETVKELKELIKQQADQIKTLTDYIKKQEERIKMLETTAKQPEENKPQQEKAMAPMQVEQDREVETEKVEKPPSKKKRTKESDLETKFEQLNDKQQQDMKLLNGTLMQFMKQVTETIRVEFAKRDAALTAEFEKRDQWIYAEFQATKNALAKEQ